MSARILILTAGFGEGHNAAARALAQAADERCGVGAARIVDVFALARPRLNDVVRKSYLMLINRSPALWRSAYAWLDRSPHAARAFRCLRRELKVLERIIAAEEPDVICSTYPLYAFMLAAIARRTKRTLPPHFNVVTDSISINSLWWRAACDGWFVPNADSEQVLVAGGVPRELILARGFPVSPVFADQQSRLVGTPGPGMRPRVLYIVNSGTRGAAETALRLLEREQWDVTCTVGRNEALRARLSEAAARRSNPATIVGWTDDMPGLLLTHHVVVSKAGGATTQEAIAARCPMVVNQIVPGQEEGNYELLRRSGVGALATTPDEVVSAVERAFADDASEWRRWRASLFCLSRPNAAREIVAVLLAAAEAPSCLSVLRRVA